MRILVYGLMLFALTFSAAASADKSTAQEEAPLILAVHPYLPSAEIQQRFAPLASYLGNAMGRKIIVRVGRNYDEHIDAIGNNSVDIAFMGPAPYVLLVSRYEKKPLLARLETDGKPLLTGVIITRKDSGLRKLSDLTGKRFAFGDRDSTMSSLIPRYMLQEAGVPLSALAGYEYLGGHKNVALGILAGDFDAGAVKREVFDELSPRGLRILSDMQGISEHLFVTRSDMPPAQVEQLRKSLLQIKSTPDGQAIMRSINKSMTNMVPVSDGDYQNLRGIMSSLNMLPR